MAELSRVNKLKDINLTLANASDDQITEIYNIFVKDVKCKNKKVNRRSMIEHMLEYIYMVTDKSISTIHDYANENDLIDDRGVYYFKIGKRNYIYYIWGVASHPPYNFITVFDNYFIMVL